MLKKDICPGMFLRNTRSGSTAEVQSDPEDPHKLQGAHRQYVAVKVLRTEGFRVVYWHLRNVEEFRPTGK